ncbi:MAG: flagellar export chaperone FlgN [Myxococcota bacterium]
MATAPLPALCLALDDEVALMRELVDACQREQAHVMAFEARELTACIGEKLALSKRLEAQEVLCRRLMGDAALELGVTPGADLTVTSLALRMPEPARAELLERATCLRSLGGALRELQAMTTLLSSRGADVVRACLEGLSGSPMAGGAFADTYTAHGRKRQDPITKRDLLTNV